VGNGGHWPFLPGNGSGAILVGAGAAPPAFGGTDVSRSRLPFSDYGSAIHVQGWGERVATTGYGSLYYLGGLNEHYTQGFNGTSSASPIVAGACALLQSVFKANNGGNPLTPAQIRQVLVNTGTPQQAGVYPVSQHIGPLPNVKAALTQIIPPKLYLNTDPKAGWIITWDGCGYLESSPLIGPVPTWAPVEVGIEHNTYTLDPAAVRADEARFYRVSWH
jgi:subtilisin family serine protease